MIKTFVLGAEYDESELCDVAIDVYNHLIIRFVGKQLNEPVVEIRINGKYKQIALSGNEFEYPAELIEAGYASIVLTEYVNGRKVKVWTVPPVNFVFFEDQFTGSDVIHKILRALPRIEALEDRVDNLETGLADAVADIGRLSAVLDDPLFEM